MSFIKHIHETDALVFQSQTFRRVAGSSQGRFKVNPLNLRRYLYHNVDL
jgi:hypothetical protein